jgi:hypothetical protein
MHLIWHHEFTTGNSSVTHSLMVVYDGLTWQIITNLGGEDPIVALAAETYGYSSFIAFNLTKQIGLIFPLQTSLECGNPNSLKYKVNRCITTHYI